jgi:hypothetical protein
LAPRRLAIVELRGAVEASFAIAAAIRAGEVAPG